ncbi:MAG: hypothetical protein C5B50_10675 [Verrucomicrobia bacterium]|nr:MAG: hypothetical protein C5B50_10675 [Verrucomicrobiota bacterium]
MKFVGRVAELTLLDSHYRSAKSALLPIYGRRRVGKSRLITEFMRDKPHIYFLGKRTTSELQLEEFRQAAQLCLRNEALEHARFSTWQEALQTVTRLWQHKQKLVLVLDELQWTAEASAELPSVLQGLWDREWKGRRNIMLILCGSQLGFMEREVLGRKSPLFGRRSDQIRLGCLSYPEAAQMLAHYSETDRASMYFMVGGVPAYLERFTAGRSLHRAIVEEFCSELKFFGLEPHFLLREELRDPARYFTILTYLAEGRMRQKELAEKSKIEARVLATYLETLTELGYVSKAHPVLPGAISPHRVLYEIADPLLRFWFRFVFPNTQLCQPGQEQNVFNQCIRPNLESYFGVCFEKLCQESLAASYRKQGILWERIGSYWDARVQIDVVGLRKDNWLDLGECKWGLGASFASLAKEMERKILLYPNKADLSIGRHLFIRQKPRQKCQCFQVHSLPDLFSEE